MAYFSNRAAQRIVSGIRRIEQIPVEPRSHRPHGPRLGGGCKKRNEVWKLKIEGTPTGGSFVIALTVNSVTENVTINFDDTAAEVKTAFATHSELVSTDLSTVGGPFPSTEIAVEFIDRFATKRMFNSAANIPVITDSGLTGGTGPSAKINFAQPGYPGNGNP